jgi:hypothetical protein
VYASQCRHTSLLCPRPEMGCSPAAHSGPTFQVRGDDPTLQELESRSPSPWEDCWKMRPAAARCVVLERRCFILNPRPQGNTRSSRCLRRDLILARFRLISRSCLRRWWSRDWRRQLPESPWFLPLLVSRSNCLRVTLVEI